MRGRRSSIWGKMGLLMLALVVTLGMMGVAYAKWADIVTINGTVTLGIISDPVYATSRYTNPSGGSISSCSAGNVLQVTIDPDDDYTYYAEFVVTNNGDIPIKIQNILLEELPEGVTANVTLINRGDIIDPTKMIGGKVTISTGTYNESFTFTVTIETVQWNRYVP